MITGMTFKISVSPAFLASLQTAVHASHRSEVDKSVSSSGSMGLGSKSQLGSSGGEAVKIPSDGGSRGVDGIAGSSVEPLAALLPSGRLGVSDCNLKWLLRTSKIFLQVWSNPNTVLAPLVAASHSLTLIRSHTSGS